jgi:hypothetical protein
MMKGKQLTLQEVLNLEDGTKVWVEDISQIFEDDLYVYDKLDVRVDLMTKRYVGYDLKTIGDFCGRIIFYEWIEETKQWNINGYVVKQSNFDGVYDVYKNNKWIFTRGSIYNVLDEISDLCLTTNLN